MKNNKKKSPMMKIVSAAAMLAVSASMLGTSTYAWFSMNKDVTVTGMSVNVQSDSTFLLVKQGTATAAQVQTAKLTRDSAVTANATLYPAAHDAITAASTGITAIDAADSTDSTVKDIWYYRYSSDPEDYMGTTPSAITYIPTGDIGQYVLINEFSVATAIGSNELENLRVKSCTITPGDKPGTDPAVAGDQAVKVLVAGANGFEEFSGTGGNGSGTNYLQTANVTSSASSTVKVYVYWDGNDTDVYTNGIADLIGTTVEVELTGDIVAAGA